MRSKAAFIGVSRSEHLLFSIGLFRLLFFLCEVAERSSRSHHTLNVDKTEIPSCLARHTDLIYWNMELKLADKTALVSGSTKGIGFAIATGLAREGARVIVNGRSEKAVAEAKQQIVQTQPDAKIESFAGDLSTAAAAETLLQRFPFVDILVNNLGIFEPKPVEDISDEDWRRFFEINVAEFEQEFFKTVRLSSLLKRFAMPEEVA